MKDRIAIPMLTLLVLLFAIIITLSVEAIQTINSGEDTQAALWKVVIVAAVGGPAWKGLASYFLKRAKKQKDANDKG